MRKLYYTIESQDLPATLGQYLERRGYSEKLRTRLRQKDLVRVNEAFHRMIDPLALGDRIAVELADEPPALIPNPRLQLEILYEDADLLVIDKPADMLVHPAGRGFDDAVANFCAARYPMSEVSPHRPAGPEHDRCLSDCQKRAVRSFADRGRWIKPIWPWRKVFCPKKRGLIDAPLLRIPGPTIQRKVDPAGQPSRTRYHVLDYLPSLGPVGHTWLQVELLTGRTHQIRAHLCYLGHPLAGDRPLWRGTPF